MNIHYSIRQTQREMNLKQAIFSPRERQRSVALVKSLGPWNLQKGLRALACSSDSQPLLRGPC